MNTKKQDCDNKIVHFLLIIYVHTYALYTQPSVYEMTVKIDIHDALDAV